MRTIADRPLGVFLSSGVDSSVVASRLAHQQLTSYRSYTAAFPGSDMDESALAAQTAAALGFPTPVGVPDALGREFRENRGCARRAVRRPVELPHLVPGARGERGR